MRADRPSRAGAAPAGRSASSRSTSPRSWRAGGHSTSLLSALTVPLPPDGVCPTRCGARPDTSHADASTAHRSAEGRCCHSSYAGVGAHDRLQRAVVGHQPGDVGDLGHEGRMVRFDVQPGGQPPQVADGEATGAQHARRAGSPVGGDLVDQAEQVGGLARRRRRRPSRPVCVVSSSGGGSRSRRRCSRSPRSRRATSRGTTTWSAESGLISWCASSQAPAVAVGPAVPRTPTGGPHVRRSRMARASGGACATSASIASPVAWLAGTDPRSSANDGPSPAGWGPSASATARTTCSPSDPRQSRAAVHRVSTNGSIALAGTAQQRRGLRHVDGVAGRRRRPRGPAGAPGPGRPGRAGRSRACRPAPRGR